MKTPKNGSPENFEVQDPAKALRKATDLARQVLSAGKHTGAPKPKPRTKSRGKRGKNSR